MKLKNSKERTKTGRPKRETAYSAAERAELKMIGDGIADLVRERGISLERFAFEQEIAKSTLFEIVKGNSNVRYCTLRTISKGLGFKNVSSFLKAVLP